MMLNNFSDTGTAVYNNSHVQDNTSTSNSNKECNNANNSSASQAQAPSVLQQRPVVQTIEPMQQQSQLTSKQQSTGATTAHIAATPVSQSWGSYSATTQHQYDGYLNGCYPNANHHQPLYHPSTVDQYKPNSATSKYHPSHHPHVQHDYHYATKYASSTTIHHPIPVKCNEICCQHVTEPRYPHLNTTSFSQFPSHHVQPSRYGEFHHGPATGVSKPYVFNKKNKTISTAPSSSSNSGFTPVQYNHHYHHPHQPVSGRLVREIKRPAKPVPLETHYPVYPVVNSYWNSRGWMPPPPTYHQAVQLTQYKRKHDSGGSIPCAPPFQSVEHSMPMLSDVNQERSGVIMNGPNNSNSNTVDNNNMVCGLPKNLNDYQKKTTGVRTDCYDLSASYINSGYPPPIVHNSTNKITINNITTPLPQSVPHSQTNNLQCQLMNVDKPQIIQSELQFNVGEGGVINSQHEAAPAPHCINVLSSSSPHGNNFMINETINCNPINYSITNSDVCSSGNSNPTSVVNLKSYQNRQNHSGPSSHLDHLTSNVNGNEYSQLLALDLHQQQQQQQPQQQQNLTKKQPDLDVRQFLVTWNDADEDNTRLSETHSNFPSEGSNKNSSLDDESRNASSTPSNKGNGWRNSPTPIRSVANDSQPPPVAKAVSALSRNNPVPNNGLSQSGNYGIDLGVVNKDVGSRNSDRIVDNCVPLISRPIAHQNNDEFHPTYISPYSSNANRISSVNDKGWLIENRSHADDKPYFPLYNGSSNWVRDDSLKYKNDSNIVENSNGFYSAFSEPPHLYSSIRQHCTPSDHHINSGSNINHNNNAIADRLHVQQHDSIGHAIVSNFQRDHSFEKKSNVNIVEPIIPERNSLALQRNNDKYDKKINHSMLDSSSGPYISPDAVEVTQHRSVIDNSCSFINLTDDNKKSDRGNHCIVKSDESMTFRAYKPTGVICENNSSTKCSLSNSTSQNDNCSSSNKIENIIPPQVVPKNNHNSTSTPIVINFDSNDELRNNSIISNESIFQNNFVGVDGSCPNVSGCISKTHTDMNIALNSNTENVNLKNSIISSSPLTNNSSEANSNVMQPLLKNPDNCDTVSFSGADDDENKNNHIDSRSNVGNINSNSLFFSDAIVSSNVESETTPSPNACSNENLLDDKMDPNIDNTITLHAISNENCPGISVTRISGDDCSTYVQQYTNIEESFTKNLLKATTDTPCGDITESKKLCGNSHENNDSGQEDLKQNISELSTTVCSDKARDSKSSDPQKSFDNNSTLTTESSHVSKIKSSKKLTRKRLAPSLKLKRLPNSKDWVKINEPSDNNDGIFKIKEKSLESIIDKSVSITDKEVYSQPVKSIVENNCEFISDDRFSDTVTECENRKQIERILSMPSLDDGPDSMNDGSQIEALSREENKNVLSDDKGVVCLHNSNDFNSNASNNNLQIKDDEVFRNQESNSSNKKSDNENSNSLSEIDKNADLGLRSSVNCPTNNVSEVNLLESKLPPIENSFDSAHNKDFDDKLNSLNSNSLICDKRIVDSSVKCFNNGCSKSPEKQNFIEPFSASCTNSKHFSCSSSTAFFKPGENNHSGVNNDDEHNGACDYDEERLISSVERTPGSPNVEELFEDINKTTLSDFSKSDFRASDNNRNDVSICDNITGNEGCTNFQSHTHCSVVTDGYPNCKSKQETVIKSTLMTSLSCNVRNEFNLGIAGENLNLISDQHCYNEVINSNEHDNQMLLVNGNIDNRDHLTTAVVAPTIINHKENKRKGSLHEINDNAISKINNSECNIVNPNNADDCNNIKAKSNENKLENINQENVNVCGQKLSIESVSTNDVVYHVSESSKELSQSNDNIKDCKEEDAENIFDIDKLCDHMASENDIDTSCNVSVEKTFAKNPSEMVPSLFNTRSNGDDCLDNVIDLSKSGKDSLCDENLAVDTKDVSVKDEVENKDLFNFQRDLSADIASTCDKIMFGLVTGTKRRRSIVGTVNAIVEHAYDKLSSKNYKNVDNICIKDKSNSERENSVFSNASLSKLGTSVVKNNETDNIGYSCDNLLNFVNNKKEEIKENSNVKTGTSVINLNSSLVENDCIGHNFDAVEESNTLTGRISLPGLSESLENCNSVQTDKCIANNVVDSVKLPKVDNGHEHRHSFSCEGKHFVEKKFTLKLGNDCRKENWVCCIASNRNIVKESSEVCDSQIVGINAVSNKIADESKSSDFCNSEVIREDNFDEMISPLRASDGGNVTEEQVVSLKQIDDKELLVDKLPCVSGSFSKLYHRNDEKEIICEDIKCNVNEGSKMSKIIETVAEENYFKCGLKRNINESSDGTGNETCDPNLKSNNNLINLNPRKFLHDEEQLSVNEKEIYKCISKSINGSSKKIFDDEKTVGVVKGEHLHSCHDGRSNESHKFQLLVRKGLNDLLTKNIDLDAEVPKNVNEIEEETKIEDYSERNYEPKERQVRKELNLFKEQKTIKPTVETNSTNVVNSELAVNNYSADEVVCLQNKIPNNSSDIVFNYNSKDCNVDKKHIIENEKPNELVENDISNKDLSLSVDDLKTESVVNNFVDNDCKCVLPDENKLVEELSVVNHGNSKLQSCERDKNNLNFDSINENELINVNDRFTHANINETDSAYCNKVLEECKSDAVIKKSNNPINYNIDVKDERELEVTCVNNPNLLETTSVITETDFNHCNNDVNQIVCKINNDCYDNQSFTGKDNNNLHFSDKRDCKINTNISGKIDRDLNNLPELALKDNECSIKSIDTIKTLDKSSSAANIPLKEKLILNEKENVIKSNAVLNENSKLISYPHNFLHEARSDDFFKENSSKTDCSILETNKRCNDSNDTNNTENICNENNTKLHSNDAYKPIKYLEGSSNNKKTIINDFSEKNHHYVQNVVDEVDDNEICFGKDKLKSVRNFVSNNEECVIQDSSSSSSVVDSSKIEVLHQYYSSIPKKRKRVGTCLEENDDFAVSVLNKDVISLDDSKYVEIASERLKSEISGNIGPEYSQDDKCILISRNEIKENLHSEIMVQSKKDKLVCATKEEDTIKSKHHDSSENTSKSSSVVENCSKKSNCRKYQRSGVPDNCKNVSDENIKILSDCKMTFNHNKKCELKKKGSVKDVICMSFKSMRNKHLLSGKSKISFYKSSLFSKYQLLLKKSLNMSIQKNCKLSMRNKNYPNNVNFVRKVNLSSSNCVPSSTNTLKDSSKLMKSNKKRKRIMKKIRFNCSSNEDYAIQDKCYEEVSPLKKKKKKLLQEIVDDKANFLIGGKSITPLETVIIQPVNVIGKGLDNLRTSEKLELPCDKEKDDAHVNVDIGTTSIEESNKDLFSSVVGSPKNNENFTKCEPKGEVSDEYVNFQVMFSRKESSKSGLSNDNIRDDSHKGIEFGIRCSKESDKGIFSVTSNSDEIHMEKVNLEKSGAEELVTNVLEVDKIIKDDFANNLQEDLFKNNTESDESVHFEISEKISEGDDLFSCKIQEKEELETNIAKECYVAVSPIDPNFHENREIEVNVKIDPNNVTSSEADTHTEHGIFNCEINRKNELNEEAPVEPTNCYKNCVNVDFERSSLKASNQQMLSNVGSHKINACHSDEEPKNFKFKNEKSSFYETKIKKSVSRNRKTKDLKSIISLPLSVRRKLKLDKLRKRNKSWLKQSSLEDSESLSEFLNDSRLSTTKRYSAVSSISDKENYLNGRLTETNVNCNDDKDKADISSVNKEIISEGEEVFISNSKKLSCFEISSNNNYSQSLQNVAEKQSKDHFLNKKKEILLNTSTDSVDLCSSDCEIQFNMKGENTNVVANDSHIIYEDTSALVSKYKVDEHIKNKMPVINVENSNRIVIIIEELCDSQDRFSGTTEEKNNINNVSCEAEASQFSKLSSTESNDLSGCDNVPAYFDNTVRTEVDTDSKRDNDNGINCDNVEEVLVKEKEDFELVEELDVNLSCCNSQSENLNKVQNVDSENPKQFFTNFLDDFSVAEVEIGYNDEINNDDGYNTSPNSTLKSNISNGNNKTDCDCQSEVERECANEMYHCCEGYVSDEEDANEDDDYRHLNHNEKSVYQDNSEKSKVHKNYWNPSKILVPTKDAPTSSLVSFSNVRNNVIKNIVEDNCAHYDIVSISPTVNVKNDVLLNEYDSLKPIIRCSLPWERVFNTSKSRKRKMKKNIKTNKNNGIDVAHGINFGPAKIEFRVGNKSPRNDDDDDDNNDNASSWKVVNNSSAAGSSHNCSIGVSPVVKVKRLILQRDPELTSFSEASTSSSKECSSSDEDNKEHKNKQHTFLCSSPSSSSFTSFFSVQSPADDSSSSSSIPKVLIRKMKQCQYKSFLKLPHKFSEPVVKLIRSNLIDNLALERKTSVSLCSSKCNLLKDNLQCLSAMPSPQIFSDKINGDGDNLIENSTISKNSETYSSALDKENINCKLFNSNEFSKPDYSSLINSDNNEVISEDTNVSYDSSNETRSQKSLLQSSQITFQTCDNNKISEKSACDAADSDTCKNVTINKCKDTQEMYSTVSTNDEFENETEHTNSFLSTLSACSSISCSSLTTATSFFNQDDNSVLVNNNCDFIFSSDNNNNSENDKLLEDSECDERGNKRVSDQSPESDSPMKRRTFKNVSRYMFHCKRCLLVFNNKEEVVKHQAAKHPAHQELHHCILCQRSFSSLNRHTMHVQSQSHRRLELLQRCTIHAMHRYFTGRDCPRLYPLTPAELKSFDWRPNQPGCIHFYHHPSPLQLALQENPWGMRNRSNCEQLNMSSSSSPSSPSSSSSSSSPSSSSPPPLSGSAKALPPLSPTLTSATSYHLSPQSELSHDVLDDTSCANSHHDS